ncbi:hypothetical protein IWW34DRAFT_796342 [Fusarium oxysporum f. sp. albedinis]|uniref:Uncharacterized protein n=1 Tax=Fusarium oxysporum f. sp. conglutinans race 2 54008 TaxID=1089457 RepID=X0H510_FUSOX|nr:hypothetical protein FOPG_16812 [Fusarium oxysporum f. sp. conglutinans race 2 54008]KAI3570890.1 hypothetical protein IWW34DRAFT_796342 [Fusarium oxysporum f. sp. albedinis]KAI8416413.1 hypothetical protein FOFC_02723 [Fusarium oxysporum]KAJ0132237.1 Uncharacterized protein HZ326_24683 [Fusarium oxysporum f. sp. albedinis]
MSPLPGGALELRDGAQELELRDGAQELDLPDGAEDVLADLQKAVKNTSPTVVGDGDERHYRYGDLLECQKFSRMVIGNKVRSQKIYQVLSLTGPEAQHILEVLLPSASLKPRLKGNPKLPVILGFDTGFEIPDGFVGMAVLITDPVNIEINSTSMTKDHFWQTGKILILKPKTSIKRMETKEQDKGKTETIGETEPDKEIILVFYTMVPVEKNY